MIPGYMQEAFFGAGLVASSKESLTSWADEEDEGEERDDSSEALRHKFNETRGQPAHRIHLDENMLRSAQQNKKSHLELGIEGGGLYIFFLNIKN